MLKTIYCYTMAWLYLVLSLPALYKVRLLDKSKKIKKKDELVYKFTSRLSRFLFKLTGSTVHVVGMEKIPDNQQVLFVSNHHSQLDSVIIHGYINKPKGFISITDMEKIPILNIWMKHMKCVFLDRSNARQMLGCIEEATGFLKNGQSMVIFPEGKLCVEDGVSEFKKGSLRLAIKAGVPIVPITLKGSAGMANMKGRDIKSAHVECVISDPIESTVSNKDEENKLIERVRNVIVKEYSLLS